MSFEVIFSLSFLSSKSSSKYISSPTSSTANEEKGSEQNGNFNAACRASLGPSEFHQSYPNTNAVPYMNYHVLNA
jgi:hypothetical protein